MARPAEPNAAAYAAAAAPAPAPLADTFKLHSLAGANHTIYLDFDGHVTSGTSWNSTYGNGNSIVSPAYDRDGNPASFSDAELAEIQRIWQRVAEDFRPFHVNVTTQDPGVEALRKSGSGDTKWGVRAVQTGDRSWLENVVGSAPGGIAYTGSFTWTSDTPVFSFNSGEVNAADTLSHEIGHALGLSHDGTAASAYYYGHGSGATGWAPLMGAGFAQSLSQWSKGEYPAASQAQDDLAIIAGTNGFGYRADDHGNTHATATLLSWAGSGLSASGIIARNTDVDVFAIDVAAGILNLDISPFTNGPNLDVLASLYNAAGQLVASSNPVSSLNASLSVVVAAGRYYLHIDGIGKTATSGDPGYSDYGSLGFYSLIGSGLQASPAPLVSVAASRSFIHEDASGTIAYTFTRTGDLSKALAVSFRVAGTAAYGSDYTVSGATSFGATSGSITFAAGSSTVTLLVDTQADAVVELNESVVIALSASSNYTLGASNSDRVEIVNDDAASVTVADAAIVEGHGGTKLLSFTVTLDRAVDAGVTLSFATTNGTAIAGSDFLAKSGALSFAGVAGEQKTVAVIIYGDSIAEFDETFELVLSGLTAGGRNVTVDRARAKGRLVNDDAGDPLGLVVGPNAGFPPLIKVYDAAGETLQYQFYAYSPAFTRGVRVALGDVTGDGVSDIVVAPVSGVAPICVFDGTNGAIVRSFLSYSQEFAGGISIAVGDVNGDGRAEIFAGLASQGGAIRVFDGQTGGMLAAYYAFAPHFEGGLNIAAADVDGDGRAEVIAAPASNAGPAVRVLEALSGWVRSAFYVYDVSFSGGVNLAAGDLDGDGRAEIITAPASQAGPPVSVVDPLTGVVRWSFYAFSAHFSGGISLATSDLNGDGRAEILAAPASGWQSIVRTIDGSTGQLLKDTYAYTGTFTGGSFVAGKPSKGQPLGLAGAVVSNSTAASLTLAEAKAVARSVSTRFAAAGATAGMLAKLASVEIIVRDLSGPSLGLARPGLVVIDVNAAGRGWFVDKTPNIDEEFTRGTDGVVRATSPSAVGRVDLLTVLAHELAHQLGFEDLGPQDNSGRLMSLTLPLSVRRATDDQLQRLLA